MARRSIILAAGVIAALAALLPATATAAAPAAAPVLTSTPYAPLVTFTWTPGAGANTSQSVFRSTGACATPVTPGERANQGGPYPGNSQASYNDTVADGVFCYYIQAVDALLGASNSPGLTVIVDTHDPAATIAIPNAVAGVVSGVVSLAATSADAASGVASSVVRVGAVGSCPVAAGDGHHLEHGDRPERLLRRLQRRRRQRRPRGDRDHHRASSRTRRRPRRPPRPATRPRRIRRRS